MTEPEQQQSREGEIKSESRVAVDGQHSTRTSGQNAPVECRTLDRYMPDPSLRYYPVNFAGPAFRVLMLAVASTALLAVLVAMGLYWVGRDGLLSLGLVWVLLGLLGTAGVTWGWRTTWMEWWVKACMGWRLGQVDLGTDRAVPQPGMKLRYEVHLRARSKVRIKQVRVRLVFWERWITRRVVRGLGLSYRSVAKQGHDLVLHVAPAIEMERGQHAVIRGALLVTEKRPSEHHRGEIGHISYVNLTTTVMLRSGCVGTGWIVGNAPHLVTFPWQ